MVREVPGGELLAATNKRYPIFGHKPYRYRVEFSLADVNFREINQAASKQPCQATGSSLKGWV